MAPTLHYGKHQGRLFLQTRFCSHSSTSFPVYSVSTTVTATAGIGKSSKTNNTINAIQDIVRFSRFTWLFNSIDAFPFPSVLVLRVTESEVASTQMACLRDNNESVGGHQQVVTGVASSFTRAK